MLTGASKLASSRLRPQQGRTGGVLSARLNVVGDLLRASFGSGSRRFGSSPVAKLTLMFGFEAASSNRRLTAQQLCHARLFT